MSLDAKLHQAAEAIAHADALLIGAGAGMGVDSGLPDFRGQQGFWRTYPPYQKLGLDFVALANPEWFVRDPTLAWGFYGHRLNLYRAAQPHGGFSILLGWARRRPQGAFVFTSNVDGQFQRAGFEPERIVEVHGSIHGLQCTRECGVGIFPADSVQIVVEETTLRAVPPMPVCPSCGALARPNILMFGDWAWDSTHAAAQYARLEQWREAVRGARLVVVECGAGTAIPSVRTFCEQEATGAGGTLIRINPREPAVPAGHIGLAMGALAALRAIDHLLAGSRPS